MAAVAEATSEKLKIVLIAPTSKSFFDALLEDLKKTFSDFDLIIYDEFFPDDIEGKLEKRYINEKDLKDLEGKNVLIIDSANTFHYSENGTVIKFNDTYRGEKGKETFNIKTQYIPMWDEKYKEGLYFNIKDGEIQTLFQELYRISVPSDFIFEKFSLEDKLKEIINIVIHSKLGVESKNYPIIFEKIDEKSLPPGDLKGLLSEWKRNLKFTNKYHKKYLKYKLKYISLKKKYYFNLN